MDMRFNTSQQMKMGQQMKLAPRMIQSMEILQLSLLALEERIAQELESNVTLETFNPEEDDRSDQSSPGESGGTEGGADGGEESASSEDAPLNVAENGSADDFARLDAMEHDYTEAFDNEYSASSATRTREYEPGTHSVSRLAGERDGKLDAMANTPARSDSLADQLIEQWIFADVDESLREAGKLLISYIDDDGYIRTDLEVILDAASATPAANTKTGGLTKETLERALLAVQLFLDPPGIGAQDVKECLLLQADAIEETEPGTDFADVRLLIEEHLDDLVHNRIPRIIEKTEMPIERIKLAMEQMKRLVLHPGRQLVSEASPALIPDAIVEYADDVDDYIVYLTDGRLPNLRINREYELMRKDRSLEKRDRDFIRTNLSNAQWLIDAIGQRRQTLLRVLRAVVVAQRDVFDQGMSALKPLPMTQVADQLGVHVATVSRAVAGKHLQTPRGILPLRMFFTGGMQTASGYDVSWEAIRASLQDVVDAEDKAKPLSDDAISAELKNRGINIARRTVAKYRGQLDIPPARMRRQF